MVMEAGLLGPDIDLEGHLLVISTWQETSLLAPRDLPLAGESQNTVLAAMQLAPQVSHPCLYWHGCSFCMEGVVLEGFSFIPPDLFLKDQSLPAVVVVLEESLIP